MNSLKLNRGKFLVTDEIPEGFIPGLSSLGFETDHFPKLSNDGLSEIIANYTGLVVNTSLWIDKTILDKAVKLKYILRPGSGLDNIDIEYAAKKNIRIFNSPEANSDAVAEHAIGMLLGLMDHIPAAYEQVQQGKWIRKPNNGVLLKGKTFGIIGYGHTGSALAEKLSGFGVKILVYDKYKSGFGTAGIIEATPGDIFIEADIVSLHIPLTPETEYLVNDAFIDHFKKPIFLLNTSRGKNVNTASVIKALKSGKLAGAALDVLENENFAKYSPQEKEQLEALILAGNVIITPHIAGWTKESREAIFMLLLEKFKNNFPSET